MVGGGGAGGAEKTGRWGSERGSKGMWAERGRATKGVELVEYPQVQKRLNMQRGRMDRRRDGSLRFKGRAGRKEEGD